MVTRPSNPRPPDDVDGVRLADELMADVAAALHDRPMQGLVAARLMLESAAATTPSPPVLLTRGMAALASAGEQSRDIMWALGRSEPEPGQLDRDLTDLLARAADPEHGLQVTVDLSDDDQTEGDQWDAVVAVVAAVHDVVVDVALRGGTVRSVDLSSIDGQLSAGVVTSPGRNAGDRSPWMRLASARLGRLGGTVAVVESSEDDQRLVVLTVPSADRPA